jgi:hypothetical protein
MYELLKNNFNILSRIRGSVINNNGFRIGFIDPSLYKLSLNYNQDSGIADLHTFQFTVVQAQGFSVSTSPTLATDLNTETITSNHSEVFMPFLVQSPWNADPPELDPILSPVPWFLTLHSSVLIHATDSHFIDVVRIT